jgi:hypothetical protein
MAVVGFDELMDSSESPESWRTFVVPEEHHVADSRLDV